MFKKLIVATLLSCFMSTASATTLFVDENGTANSYTKNESVKKIRTIPYHLKGLIPKGNVYIPEGTRIEITPQSNVNGGYLRTGDVIHFELREDFIINDIVMAPKGTTVPIRVIASKHSWGYGHGGELSLKADDLCLQNDVHVPVRFYFHQKNESMNDIGVFLAADTFTGIGLLTSLLVHGGDVRIPEYRVLTLSVAEDTDLGITVEQLRNSL